MKAQERLQEHIYISADPDEFTAADEEQLYELEIKRLKWQIKQRRTPNGFYFVRIKDNKLVGQMQHSDQIELQDSRDKDVFKAVEWQPGAYIILYDGSRLMCVG